MSGGIGAQENRCTRLVWYRGLRGNAVTFPYIQKGGRCERQGAGRKKKRGLGNAPLLTPSLSPNTHSNKFEKCRKEQAAFEAAFPAGGRSAS